MDLQWDLGETHVSTDCTLGLAFIEMLILIKTTHWHHRNDNYSHMPLCLGIVYYIFYSIQKKINQEQILQKLVTAKLWANILKIN